MDDKRLWRIVAKVAAPVYVFAWFVWIALKVGEVVPCSGEPVSWVTAIGFGAAMAWAAILGGWAWAAKSEWE